MTANTKKLYRYKFYRKYVTDLWGLLTTRKKQNTTLKYISKKLVPLIRRKIKKIAKRKLRKKMYKKFALRKKYFNPNKIFDLSQVSKESRKLRVKRLTYRGLLLAMKRKMRVYYGLKISRKKLRKLSFLVKIKSNRFFSRILESRLDSLLLRSNFASSILEARQLVNHGKVNILVPRTKNSQRISWMTITNPGHRVPLYTPIEMKNKWKLKRKHYLVKTLLSRRLCSYPPDYLYVNFKMMHSFTTSRLRDSSVKFIFPGKLSYFAGLSKYY